MTIEQALAKHTPWLMSIEGVAGTAQGLCAGVPCIKVYLAVQTPEVADKIPATLEGHPVDVIITGEIKALPKERG